MTLEQVRALRLELERHGWRNVTVDKSYRVAPSFYASGTDLDEFAQVEAYLFMCGYEPFSDETTRMMCEDAKNQGAKRVYFKDLNT